MSRIHRRNTKNGAGCEWLVDGPRIDTPTEFMARRIPHLAARAVRQLGLDAADVELEPQLDHLALYATGAFYDRRRDLEDESSTNQPSLTKILLKSWFGRP